MIDFVFHSLRGASSCGSGCLASRCSAGAPSSKGGNPCMPFLGRPERGSLGWHHHDVDPHGIRDIIIIIFIP